MSDQPGGIGGRYRGLKPMDDLPPDTGTADGGDPGDESGPAAPPAEDQTDDLQAIRETLSHFGKQIGMIRHEHDKRLTALEPTVNQTVGQYQAVEQAIMQDRQFLGTLDARITAVAQAVGKNWRLAACEIAAKARQPGESPTKLMEMAKLFAEFIDPPAPPAPSDVVKNDEAERVGEVIKSDPETKH